MPTKIGHRVQVQEGAHMHWCCWILPLLILVLYYNLTYYTWGNYNSFWVVSNWWIPLCGFLMGCDFCYFWIITNCPKLPIYVFWCQPLVILPGMLPADFQTHGFSCPNPLMIYIAVCLMWPADLCTHSMVGIIEWTNDVGRDNIPSEDLQIDLFGLRETWSWGLWNGIPDFYFDRSLMLMHCLSHSLNPLFDIIYPSEG